MLYMILLMHLSNFVRSTNAGPAQCIHVVVIGCTPASLAHPFNCLQAQQMGKSNCAWDANKPGSKSRLSPIDHIVDCAYLDGVMAGIEQF